MKKRLVVGNWKLYIESPEEAKHFATTLRKKSRSFSPTETWLVPSFVLIPTLAAALKGSSIKVGAQTVSVFESGAHTGEVSAANIKNAGASFTLVGHSERRALGDTNELVHQQLVHATGEGLTTILCIGEIERDPAGGHFSTITEQLTVALLGMMPFANKIIVAYEPVWAIGKTAESAMKPAEVEEMVIFIKKTLADIVGREKALKVPILYGGSVEPENAKELIGTGVNGFLVGHASAEVEQFIEILKSCRK
jgi:triosephosphate isomerase